MRARLYFENDIHLDYDIEWFTFTTLYVTCVYWSGLKEIINIIAIEVGVEVHLDSPGVLREQRNHGFDM